jgi:hypothetical protein
LKNGFCYKTLRCVLFCTYLGFTPYSAVQAKAIADYIPYVIGMQQAIGNKAAIEFAVAFYDALATGQSIEFAYKLGCVAIQMAGIPQHSIPILIH